MATPQPIEPAELLAHAGWMRALAGSLVADASSADDVVQESLVAALHRPPAPGRPLEAWLSRVVRNVASNFRRRESAQVQRRVQAVANEGLADPSEIIERLDTQRMIVELVRELDEPSRSTIVLRYFEGLSSEEIGRRMGVSDATVRWRLQKGLEQLRSRLQRNFGSREAWCAVLAPLANTPITGTVAASSGAAAGAIVMGTASKLVAAAVAAVVLGTGIWFAVDRKTPTVRSAEIAWSESKKVHEPIAALEAGEPEREVLAAPPDHALLSSQAAIAAKAESGVTESSLAVRARFVDSVGRPWSGVAFSLHGIWPLSARSTGSSTTEADGVAELSFAASEVFDETNFEFTVTRTGCGSLTLHASLAQGRVVDLGDVVLEREARVLGRVQDAQGAGLAQVTVGLLTEEQFQRRSDAAEMRRQGPWNPGQLIITESDAQGAFELRAVPSGRWRLWGHREGLGYGCTQPFELQAGGEKSGLDFVVPALLATDTITGTVVDPEGKPVAEAVVTFRWGSRRGSSGSTSAASRADGNFKLVLNTESSGDLSAEAHDHRLASAVLRDMAPGTRGIVVQLADVTAQQQAYLRIHDFANAPIREAQAMVFERQKHGGHLGRRLTIKEIEPGLYEFQPPRLPFYLVLSADGYIEGKLPDLDPEKLAPELDLALELSPLLKGRVLALGNGVSKAKVEAFSAVRQGQTLIVNGFPSLMRAMTKVSGFSNEEGAFTLKLQGKDPVYLRCVAEGFAPKVVGPIDIDTASGPIEIALDAGGAIEGHVRAKDGTPIVGAIVGVTCGDAHPLTMLSGHEGRFRFDGLSAGSWLVIERHEEVTAGTSEEMDPRPRSPIEWSCVVTSGQTTYHDLQLDH